MVLDLVSADHTASMGSMNDDATAIDVMYVAEIPLHIHANVLR